MWCFPRDKKARRAEKQKGKGKKDEEPTQQGVTNSNDQNGNGDVIVDPPVRGQVTS